jgi:hypothetical protein
MNIDQDSAIPAWLMTLAKIPFLKSAGWEKNTFCRPLSYVQRFKRVKLIYVNSRTNISIFFLLKKNGFDQGDLVILYCE